MFRKVVVSPRSQRVRRGASLAAALAVATAVTIAVWPAGGGTAAGAGPLRKSGAQPSESVVARTSSPSHAVVRRSAAPSRSADRTPARPSHRRAVKASRPVDGQQVTVTARTRRSTVATVRRWVHRSGRWVRVGAAMHAYVGVAGLTRHPSEKLAATPIGSFPLTQAFGARPNRRHRITELRYIHIRYGDTWGSRPSRPTYNRYFNCHCRGATLFALRRSLFRYGMVIDYNRTPVVRGAGSGFFVHVTNHRPTAGCVALPARNVRTLLRWLRPDLHPHIVIGVAHR